MKKVIEYKDLDNYFILPKVIGYDSYIKLPRKLKKKVKKFCGCNWKGLTNGQRLWWYLETNKDYKRFLEKQLLKR